MALTDNLFVDRPLAGRAYFAGHGIGHKANRSSRFPPRVLLRGVASARTGRDIGEDQSISRNGNNHKAIPSAVDVLDKEGAGGNTDSAPVRITLKRDALA